MKRILVSGCLLIGVSGIAFIQDLHMGTTTALRKTPSVQDFKDAKENDIEYVEVALNPCYRHVSEDEVTPRMEAMKSKDGEQPTAKQLADSFKQIKPEENDK